MTDKLAFKPGSNVKLTGDIPALVVGICLRVGNHISYEVAWWSQGQRYTSWIEEFEISGNESDMSEIGFR